MGMIFEVVSLTNYLRPLKAIERRNLELALAMVSFIFSTDSFVLRQISV